MMSKYYEVSAIVYSRHDGSILLAQRGRQQDAAWAWEFPGGKVEPGEDPLETALRESQEELGYRAPQEEVQFLGKVEYQDENERIDLHIYAAPWNESKEPYGPAHELFRWLPPDPRTLRIACVPLLPATDRFLDTPAWDQYRRELGFLVHNEEVELARDVDETEARDEIQALQNFIREAPTAYQASEFLAQELEAHGFEYLPFKREEAEGSDDYLHHFEDCLRNTDNFFIRPSDSSLIAFLIGSDGPEAGLRIWGGHLDSPALQIKSDPMVYKEGFALLSASVYGGPLLNTFFDRPLSLAGSVLVRDEDEPLGFRQMNCDLSPLTIVLPSLAIHMNRDANKGVPIEPQKVLLPVLGIESVNKDPLALHRLIADQVDCDPADILDFDLYTYPTVPGQLWGMEREFLLAPRIDNLAMSYAGFRGFLQANQAVLTGEGFPGISILYLMDHEEIGSRTRAGAQSNVLPFFLRSIAEARGLSKEAWLGSLARSFAISADAAHAVHPHHAEIADTTQRPKLNSGLTIKYAPDAYATDARSAAQARLFCEEAGVPYQTFSNRADLRGGSTIGPLLSVQLPIDNVDIGIPIWGMHSLYETMGIRDQARCVRLARALFDALES